MTTTGLIPRARLARIPRDLQLAHQYCFFLHDECVRLLTEYEAAEAHIVSVKFKSKVEAKTFKKIAKTSAIEALRATGYPAEARRVILNTITMGMVSDCLHHLFEALKCLEKRKTVVALNLLRKPLMDSLLYLSWMHGDQDAFYNSFTAGDPEALTQKRLGNHRQSIIANALAKTDVAELLDSSAIHDAIFDAKSPAGLYGLFQHAVHLITVDRIELRTAPENFNFIFKRYTDDDIYECVYGLLPSLLLYLSNVVLELFTAVKPAEGGSKTAFFVRSTYGFYLVEGGERATFVRTSLNETFGGELACDACAAPIVFSHHNAARTVLSESVRCGQCRRVHSLPFSWLFGDPEIEAETAT